jgi:YegS/Rv2252/BmrU family lipid kinase
MSRTPELRARWQSRVVNLLILGLELLQAIFLKASRWIYDGQAREAKVARLSRRLALLEGPSGGAAALLGNGRRAPAARKVKIIANPISGRGMALKAIPHLQRGFRELGFDVEVIVTERAGQARQACWALEKNVAAVVSIGGDGTLNEVVNGVGDQNVPIAVYATGTANCIAKEFGIPRHPELFCRMVAEGRTVALDVAEHWHSGGGRSGVGGQRRRFHSFAGVGFDAKVVEELSKQRTGAIHMATYAGPIAKALRNYDWPAIRVEVDGEEIATHAGLVIVSNIKGYAVMEVAGAADSADGLLDVCIFQTRTWLAMVRYAFGAFTKTHTKDRDVIYVQGRHVKIAADRPNVPMQVDGDSAGALPAELRVIPGAIRFFVPASYRAPRKSGERAGAALGLPAGEPAAAEPSVAS